MRLGNSGTHGKLFGIASAVISHPNHPGQEHKTQTTNKQPSVYVRSWLLMDYRGEKLKNILGVTGEKSSTTTFYKSAALPTELRQP